MGILDDRVAVITGGTRGLGLAVARAFLREGAAVVVASRSQAAVDRALGQLGPSTMLSGLPCDVTSYEQVQALLQYALKRYGRLDIWVNNAGVASPYGPTMDTDPRAFLQVLNTNIIGVYNGSHAAMLHFLLQKSGKLINILGRGSNNDPVPMQNAYTSTKAWNRSFTLALAKETAGSGVGVYAINPGMMATDFLTDLEVISGNEDKLKVMDTIVRMWARPPAEAAQKVLWLASAATDSKTGLLLNLTNLLGLAVAALKEGLRRLAGQKAPAGTVKITPIPVARGTLKG